MLTTPSLKSQKNFRREIKTELAKLKAATQAEVVAKIHPKITGWMHYFKHCAAKKVFKKIDHWLWQTLWKWSKRRHPNKNCKWVKKKYFHRYQGQDWYFGYWDKKRNTPIFRHLPRMSNIPIKRHVLIKGDFNHYDSQWKSYAESRSVKLMKNTMTDMVYKLWIKEAGKCKYCYHEINDMTTWHIHHKLPRHKGGSMAIDNLVLLHPECHRQLHSSSAAGLPVHGGLIYA